MRATASYTAAVAVLSAGSAVAATAAVGSLAAGDAGAGCTINSFASPSWFVQDFQYAKGASNSSGVSFRVLNRATNASADVTCRDPAAGSSSGGVAAWSQCSTTKPGFNASLQLDGPAAHFLINETWSCSDQTPGKPYGLGPHSSFFFSWAITIWYFYHHRHFADTHDIGSCLPLSATALCH